MGRLNCLCMNLRVFDSYDTHRSPREIKAQPTERQDLVCGAKLCHDRRGSLRRFSMSLVLRTILYNEC